MPSAITARLARELDGVLKGQALQDKLARAGLAVDYKPQAEFVSFMQGDIEKWRTLLPAMGIQQVD
jgi:tripartite-type tricarboxylate transporter receptor subunit TctC